MFGRIAILSIGSVAVASGGIIATMYLSKNETIRDRVEKEGIKLIKQEDTLSWKTAFKELKTKSEVISELKKMDSAISNNSDLTKGGEALKSFCGISLEKPIDSENDLFSKVKGWCVQLPLTVKDKLLSLGKELETAWEGKFNSIKTGNSDGLKEDLKAINDQITKELTDDSDKDKFVKALEKWCENNLQKNLMDADSIFEKVKNRCLKNGT